LLKNFIQHKIFRTISQHLLVTFLTVINISYFITEIRTETDTVSFFRQILTKVGKVRIWLVKILF